MPKKTRDMWKEKRWFTVYAPSLFGNCEIGETLGLGPDKLRNRTIETTLREVTGDFTQHHVKLYFQISDVRGEKAYTRFIGHDLTRDYVRMHVRRGTTRVDSITQVTTQDGHKIRVRALAFTLQRVAASQSKAIRAAMTNVTKAAAERSSFSGFIHEMILGKLSADIHKQVKLIYPIKKIEIMKSKIIFSPPEAEQTEIIAAEQPVEDLGQGKPSEQAIERPAPEEAGGLDAGGEPAEDMEEEGEDPQATGPYAGPEDEPTAQ